MYKNNRLDCAGYSLIEFILALTISTLIISGLMRWYVSCHQLMLLQSALQQNQQKALFVIKTFTNHIKHTGYLGCFSLSAYKPVLSQHEQIITLSNRISGDENNLELRYLDFPNAELIHSSKSSLVIKNGENLPINKGLLMADCKHNEAFSVEKMIKSRYYQQLILLKPLIHRYDKFSEIGPVMQVRFYVYKSKIERKVSALFRQDYARSKIELISGIEQLKFYYTVAINHQFKTIKLISPELAPFVVGVGFDFVINTPPIKKEWHGYSRLGSI